MIDIQTIIRSLEEVLEGQPRPVTLHAPVFAGQEWAYVKECLDTGWVSSVGSFVDRFERDLADFTEMKRAVVTVNGTAALHLCLLLAGVKPDEEVLLPDFTFIATANAVTYCNAVPHFVDVNESTLGVCPERLRTHLRGITARKNGVTINRRSGRQIRALIVMHTFGHAVDLDGVLAVCREFDLVLIEDAAESIGSYYRGRHTGHWGLISALSFNGNKTITTGGGGAILTNDEELGHRAKFLSTQAKKPHPWEFIHEEIGYNYRLPNVNAALGCAQLEQLPGFLIKKRTLAERYRKAFSGVSGVQFFTEPPNCRSNYWLNALLLNVPSLELKDALLQATNDRGIMTRPAWKLMHQLPMFADLPRADCSVAESLSLRLINLPSSSFLATEDAG
ncbi:MAG: LegC family aminotransferase [Candidatus Ozemobacteraceae bacterium]